MKDNIEIDFTDWTGKQKGKLIIPKVIDESFKIAIVHFLSEIDDHDSMSMCCKAWNMSESDWDSFCRLI